MRIRSTAWLVASMACGASPVVAPPIPAPVASTPVASASTPTRASTPPPPSAPALPSQLPRVASGGDPPSFTPPRGTNAAHCVGPGGRTLVDQDDRFAMRGVVRCRPKSATGTVTIDLRVVPDAGAPKTTTRSREGLEEGTAQCLERELAKLASQDAEEDAGSWTCWVSYY